MTNEEILTWWVSNQAPGAKIIKLPSTRTMLFFTVVKRFSLEQKIVMAYSGALLPFSTEREMDLAEYLKRKGFEKTNKGDWVKL